MTVIISSSEHEELLDIADRIYVFYEGYLSDMLAGEHKTEEHLVAAMMGMTSSPTDTITAPPNETLNGVSEKREEAETQ
jgi:ABC-type multidrug transport system ATPase subunit